MFSRLYESILRESDKAYKAKVGSKWLGDHKLVDDEKKAHQFESETEPRQIINQMKKDGKIDKNVSIDIKAFNEK